MGWALGRNLRSDAAIREFQKLPGATISVWGSGMIDLSSDSKGVDDFLRDGFNWGKTQLDKWF